MPEIVRMHMNDELLQKRDCVMVEIDTGKMLWAVASAALEFSRPDDDDPIAAFQRMFDARPELFKEVRAERARVDLDGFVPHAAGFTSDLTIGDRQKMRAIVRKHHRQYFADHPTDAQVDQLIDSLGPEVASKLVKAAVDRGAL